MNQSLNHDLRPWQIVCEHWLGFVCRYGYAYLGLISEDERQEARQEITDRLDMELQLGAFSIAGYQLTATDDSDLLRLGHVALALISHVRRNPFVRAIATGCVAEAIMGRPDNYAEFSWVVRTVEAPIWNKVQREVEPLVEPSRLASCEDC